MESNVFAIEVVNELYKVLKITDKNAATCVKDVGGANMYFKHFAQDIASKNYSTAVFDISRGLNSLSTAMNDCGTREVQIKIDALASAIKWANISTAALDETVKILVGASDLWQDIEALAKAVLAKDTTAIGQSLSTLLDAWSSITGGCEAMGNSTACRFMDGLLHILSVTEEQIAPCEAALHGPILNLTAGAASFRKKDYKLATQEIMFGLGGISEAITADSCGLHAIGASIIKNLPSLANAVVKVESSDAVQILVGSADIYEDLFNAVQDLDRGDWTGFGMQMGKLLAKLQTSGCTTRACTVLQGILASLQLEADDFEACTKDVDNAWGDLSKGYSDLLDHKYVDGVSELGDFLVALSHGVSGCGIPDLGKILEQMASQMGDSALANEIGDVVQVLVNGADVTLDMAKLEADFRAGQWSGVGQDLGDLATWLTKTQCKSYVCQLVEGLLEGAEIAFSHLEGCEADLRKAESLFTAGASYWSQHKYKQALQYWATGLNSVAQSVQDCGAAEEMQYLQQEANALGFGNITALGDAASILVHGADFYEELFATFQEFATHDYKAAGSNLGKVLNQLSQWTKGHACTNDFCYVVVGVMEFFGEFQGSVGACKADFEGAWADFKFGAGNLTNSTHSGIEHIFNLNHDAKAVKIGINDIGLGMHLVAKGVGDCHLQALADLIEKLAIKLGLAPEVSFIETLLKILIDGVEIEEEIGDACQDYSSGNWVGFGYNVAKIVKSLLAAETYQTYPAAMAGTPYAAQQQALLAIAA
jgi:hypothetical protein